MYLPEQIPYIRPSIFGWFFSNLLTSKSLQVMSKKYFKLYNIAPLHWDNGF